MSDSTPGDKAAIPLDEVTRAALGLAAERDLGAALMGFLEQLKAWAASCPENFEHKHLLVEAEKARVLGQKDEALRLYLDGHSYESMGEELDCDCKTIDNALQRVKRKILTHQATRAVPA